MGIQISIDGLDGDMTFEEWKASLTDEQRAAMKANAKAARRKTAKSVDKSGGSGIMDRGVVMCLNILD